MKKPLMPKATAVWLIDNTALSFDQIAEFTGLHLLEIQAIADGDVAGGMLGLDPVQNGQLSWEEIKRCEADSTARLNLLQSDIPEPKARKKGPRYTPLSKRADKPDAIAWLVKEYPELKDTQISRLVGTTKPTITAIRQKTHWNMSNLRPRSPIELGLCNQSELVAEIDKARKVAKRVNAD